MIVLNNTFVDHPFGELKLLHGFVNKSECESIHQPSSRHNTANLSPLLLERVG